MSFSVVENMQQADQELAENSYDFVLLSDAQSLIRQCRSEQPK
ncbi:hypothetical protein THIOSC13_1560004 [uncultured Thiomicrorhabdus sp.]